MESSADLIRKMRHIVLSILHQRAKLGFTEVMNASRAIEIQMWLCSGESIRNPKRGFA